MTTGYDDEVLYAGLQSYVDAAFPKQCANCGRYYETVADFVHQTKTVGSRGSGLKQSVDDDERTIVEMYRNCICGSTLMDFFSDRRDQTERGQRRRERFDEVHAYLVSHGVDAEVARGELRRELRGERSELLRSFKGKDK